MLFSTMYSSRYLCAYKHQKGFDVALRKETNSTKTRGLATFCTCSLSDLWQDILLLKRIWKETVDIGIEISSFVI